MTLWKKLLIAGGIFLASACQQKMGKLGHLRPDSPSPVFGNGTIAREAVPGTVPWEAPKSASRPVPVTLDFLKRGRERYEIYCSPCHGLTGNGGGMIVQRGFIAPPSFHISRLRELPDSYFFDVITRGYGAMYSYADRVEMKDRWAILAYIRVLQLSQSAKVSALNEKDFQHLQNKKGGP